MMKVLIVGGGGREHALAWKVAASPKVTEVYVAPGNAGTAAEPKVTNVAIGTEDIDALLGFAQQEHIDLTVVGPEVPLTLGIVDRFKTSGLPCFGPSQVAAQLEASKSFAKQFLVRQGIPTAQFRSFEDADAANRHIDEVGAPIVIKADGLAAGKGVTVAETVAQAKQAVGEMLQQGRFGAAGSRVVIEEYLEGKEVSFICIVDGEDVVPLATAQDHKRVGDADQGPNTGGMGAYSPAPIIDSAMQYNILNQIIHPTVRGLLQQGIHYTGFLYAGLMISPPGVPQVLEYNCRMGDPETQPILMRLQSDLVELMEAALQGRLKSVTAHWNPQTALSVVAAAGGYPGVYETGAPITGLQNADMEYIKVFHAGTAAGDDGEIVVSGGRVLCVTALADNIAKAQSAAYQAMTDIHFRNMHYRKDIGATALHPIETNT